ncbi:MAG: aldo/keto reductase [Thaumarchaeota archaeon]|nr:aldo/keto reductase [Nitrososphaerota archaeon]
MRYRTLGRSGLRVSEIGFGAWAIAMDWWGKKVEEDEAIRMIRRAYDLGINFFETADMYGKGKSERLLGRALEGVRDEVVISTKYGYDFAGAEQVGHSELPQSFSGEFTRAALRASLDRLRTGRVDVYGMHNPKLRHIRDDSAFGTLSSLVGEGIVRACQVALGPAIGWTREGMEAMDRPEVSAVQTVYNILEQTPGNELAERAEQRNVGLLVRVPDASGILTGKVGADTKIDEKDHRSVRKGEWIRASLAKVEELRPIAESNGLRIDELAIKFLLSRGAVSSVLPTVVGVEEVESFAAMSDGRALGASDMAEIARLYSSWPGYELKASA